MGPSGFLKHPGNGWLFLQLPSQWCGVSSAGPGVQSIRICQSRKEL
ncbi:LSM7 homolog, U6 small nuclear RNA associated (S. cerevisiae) (predicted), isoform CRA_a [Rattus norvegicus]|uniref:LSM7 homolog, U6 small nuclear RNA associated (S. cerevisiae) (Predicted), isoform CRA_a n=1 Tax=Rattus norvegicus TaxID=10116 RepID=A6K8F0_RAT|nr:LSM7 homolog, U6 small nuclear RNA associated (S. cerevisiae) (predicted), isoform CRA_a [Rattus norvegicus]